MPECVLVWGLLLILPGLQASMLHCVVPSPAPTRMPTKSCLYLTVSSERQITFHWTCSDTIFDTIELFKGNESLLNVSGGPDIVPYQTDVVFNPVDFPEDWGSDPDNNPICLGYHGVAYYEGYEVSQPSCIGIWPLWMNNLRPVIRNLTLPQLFIPGTHNSGCNQMKAAKRKKRGTGGPLDSWVLTQDQSVWHQLAYGIRYFDFRVGYYPQRHGERSNIRFWLNHDLIRVQPLEPILLDIIRFLMSSPQEVVILDFHRFPIGFTQNSVHKELVDLLWSVLRYWILPRPPNPSTFTLEDIWLTHKRIIVSYNSNNVVAETPWLWAPIPQRWGNQQSVVGLRRFLNETFQENTTPGTEMWAAMAELTPTPMDVFTKDSSLAEMADTVNMELGGWFTDEEWRDKVNIVATDYFMGNNLIHSAIKTNTRRGYRVLRGVNVH